MREGNLKKGCNPSENNQTWPIGGVGRTAIEEIMNFAMDIEKLNLANFVGKVMNKFMVVPEFFAKVKCTER